MVFQNRQKRHMIDGVFILALICVFATSSLIVMLIGSNVYKNTASNMESSFSGRTSLSFITQKLRQNDKAGAVSIGEVEGVEALVLKDLEGSFATYIYFEDGYLTENFTHMKYSPTLGGGQQLISLQNFEMIQNPDNTFTFTAEDESGTISTITIALESSI